MDQETKQALEGLQSSFAALQTGLKDMHTEVQKAGEVSAETEAKIDRINTEVGNHKVKLDEVLERGDQIELKVNRLRQSAGLPGLPRPSDAQARLEELTRMQMAVMLKTRVEDLPEDYMQQHAEYRKAFLKYARSGAGPRGDNLPADIQNALSVGSDPDGGFIVPATMLDRIITRLFETSPMRQVAGVIQISTDALEMPRDTDDATSGGWVGEAETRSETETPDLGMHRIPVHEQYAEPRATQKLIDDAAIDVEAWLSRRTADKIIRTENAAFVTGNGVARPHGFVAYATAGDVTTDADADRTWGNLQYVASGAAGAFATRSGMSAHDYGPLVDLQSALNPQYRMGAVWAMNRGVEGEVRKLIDNEGRPLVQLNLREGGLGFELLGDPIVNFQDMADIAANSYSIAYGNFAVGYQIVDRIGIRVLRDPYTGKPFVKFYTTKRVGGDVVNFDAIKLLKFATS